MCGVRLCAAICVSLLAVACTPSTRYELVVEAGTYARSQTVVSFSWPAEFEAEHAVLVDSEGQVIAVQQMPNGRGFFVLEQLAVGETARFTLREATQTEAQQEVLQAERVENGVVFQQAHQPMLRYQAEPGPLPDVAIDSVYLRGGYIHPIYTPSGVVITDDYPHNHVHHHGIWAAWTNTRYQGRTPDFWNMGSQTGTVMFERLDTLWSGRVVSGLTARHQYVDLSADEPTPVLREAWAVNVYKRNEGARPYHVFDLTVTQEVIGDDPLELPAYRYGGVGFRGHGQWNGSEHTFFLTSEGRDRSDGHATRARWCHVGGYVDGQLAGITILGHPDNVEAPQPMRIHPTEPFFNWAPTQAGDLTLAPGKPLVLRYRYVVYDGEPDVDALNRMWDDYAYPPTVTITAL